MGLKSLGKKAEECQGIRVIESGDRLHTFRPKPGGQTEFYELVMESMRSGKFPRAVDLIGGIGCFAGDTLINGVPAKELQSSPITVDTLIGELPASPVYLKGQANLYRVITTNGKRIEVTERHQMMTPKGWKPLHLLRVGDALACCDKQYEEIDWGNTRDSLWHYLTDQDRGDESLHPLLVFALDKIRQVVEPLCAGSLFEGQFLRCTKHSLPPSFAHTPLSEFQQPSFARTTCLGLLQRFLQYPQSSLRSDSAIAQFAMGWGSLQTDTLFDENRNQEYPALLQQYFLQLLQSLLFSFEIGSSNKLAQFAHTELCVASTFQAIFRGTLTPCRLGEHSLSTLLRLTQQLLAHLDSSYLSSIARLSHSAHEHLNEVFQPSIQNSKLPLYVSAHWDKIEAIEYVRYDDFYDLHVPIANHYLANDFWNHNSGKSYMGAWYACMMAKHDPNSRGLISANDYGQLSQASTVALAEFCEKFNVPLSPQGETPEETARMICARRLCTIYDASVFVLSASKFGGSTAKSKQGARGLQSRWAWLDEWAYADKSAWETLNGRLGRGEGTIPGQAVITSSINRNYPFNWVYDTFSDPDRSQEIQQLYKAIRCLTADNDSLDPEYLRSLEASYTPELAALELRGEYVSATEGLIFRYFRRTQHVDGGLGYNPRYPLHLSFDFNHSPACAIAAQSDGHNLFILKEWYLLNSDTFELAEKVANWAKPLQGLITPYGVPANPVFVYGDASGSARSANSKTTNWAIVTAELKGLRWTQRWGSVNPSIVDSVHSYNSMLFQNRVYVHPDCRELTKDFESMKWDDKGGIDKSDIRRTHLADCARYLVATLFPLPDARRQWRTDGVASWS